MSEPTFNKIYPKRGLPFSINDYPESVQKVWREKIRPVDEIIAQLPSNFRFVASFCIAQPREFLRRLGERKNFEQMECFASFLLEPYDFLKAPNVSYKTCYLGPAERMLNDVMKKTIHFIPKQYTHIGDAVSFFAPEYCLHSATVPDEEGYVNLGLNNAADEPYIRECLADPRRKVILEINAHTPWVQGDPQLGDHKIHLSEVDFIYENHEPLFQLPPIAATEKEKSIATFASEYIKDESTIQLGIGGIPNYIASQITNRKDIGVHTEMLTDSIVDLHHSGALTNRCKGYREGQTVCGFIAGTDKLYDWVDRNPSVVILPIKDVNSPHIVARCNNFVSVNAGLMVDFTGQVCSDSIGVRQYSGPGGQFEFVEGSSFAHGGKSIICIKSSATIKEKLISNIVFSLPSGSAVTVPRFFTDTIITEYGIADLRYKSKLERVKALIEVAHPEFREQLAEQAQKANILEASEGFDKVSQKIFYESVSLISKLKRKFSLKKILSR